MLARRHVIPFGLARIDFDQAKGQLRTFPASQSGQFFKDLGETHGKEAIRASLFIVNRVFNDRVALTGVTRDETGLVIVTSQPTIIGEGATRDEMTAFFASLHFAPVPGFSAGYRGALTFYRDLDQVAVFEAHPANYLRDRHGVILPIDGVVVECGSTLAAQMETLLRCSKSRPEYASRPHKNERHIQRERH